MKIVNIFLFSCLGNSNKIAIKIFAKNADVSSVTINERIPLKFNILRVICIFSFLAFIYCFKNLELFNQPFSGKNLKQELILLLVMGAFLFITCYLNNYSKDIREYDFYAKDFVESISRGEFFLSKKPNDKLLNMNNPYDTNGRVDANIERGKDYYWDTVLYNGKFYVYFGILPALVLFLPYYLLTGKFLYSATGVLVFSILAIIALKELIEIIFKKFFKELDFKYMVLSLIILLFGSQILFLNGVPRYYELPIVAGLFFSITGIDLILLSVYGNKINYKKMFFGSLFLALSVACRPTQLLTSLIIVPIVLRVFIDNVKNKKDIIKNIISIAIPYMSVGILLMIYNYVRFGSILEFGAKYQLTINDMLHLSNRIYTIGTGIVCNLFSIPNFISVFPFVDNHNKLISFYGYYYIENMVGGLFILVPISFMIFKFFTVLKKSKNRELVTFISALIITGIAICVISIAMGGSMQRYIADYAWIFILAGICIFLEIYKLYQTKEAKHILGKILLVVTIYIVFINLFSGIISEKSYFKNISPEQFYNIRYTIDFWE